MTNLRSKARAALGLVLCALFGCGCAAGYAGYAAPAPRQREEEMLRALYAQSAAAVCPAKGEEAGPAGSGQAPATGQPAALPEPAGELVICMGASDADGLTNGALLQAVREFERLHPGLELRIETVVGGTSDPERRERELDELRAGLAAGEGPDLFLFEGWLGRSYLWPDLYKAMREGAFLDVAPLLAAHGVEVTGDEFWQPVMAAGRLGEAQLLTPLTFTVPVALAGQNALLESGFDTARAGQSTAAFLQECAAVYDRSGQTVEFWVSPLSIIAQQVLDYDTGEVRLDTPAVRQMLAAGCGLLTAPWRQPEEPMLQAIAAGQGAAYEQQQAARLAGGECLMAVTQWDCVEGYARLLAAQKTPAELLALPSEDGSVTAEVCSAAAIRRDAANPNAAAALLAFLLDEEQQSAGAYPGTFWGLPVRRGSLAPSLAAEYDYWQSIWYLDPTEEEVRQWEQLIGEPFAPMEEAERSAYFERLGQPVPPNVQRQLAKICSQIKAAHLPSGWPSSRGPQPGGEEILRCEEAFYQGELTADELTAALQPLLEEYLRAG